tara:strand:+ start:623 stop:781 length:159 start_codon:yes stop_codon:yes gene_type:complete
VVVVLALVENVVDVVYVVVVLNVSVVLLLVFQEVVVDLVVSQDVEVDLDVFA